MSIIFWIVLGLVAGMIAKAIDPHPQSGSILWTIVLGIIGAVVGGFLGGALLGLDVNGFNIESIITAVLGALLVLWLGRRAGQTF